VLLPLMVPAAVPEAGLSPSQALTSTTDEQSFQEE
jgi:hypothetical protein